MTLVDTIRDMEKLEEAKSPEQQAAIAIAKKEKGEEPKKEEAEKCEKCDEVHEGECSMKEEAELDESTKSYAKSLEKIADKAKRGKIEKSDLETLSKLADLMMNANEEVEVEEIDTALEEAMTSDQLKKLRGIIGNDGFKDRKRGIEKIMKAVGVNQSTAASYYAAAVKKEEVEVEESVQIEESVQFGGVTHSQSLLDAISDIVEGKMDKVDKKALKKDFDDRKDKDIDNDGDVDDSDEYLHKRRQAISKDENKGEDVEADEKKAKENKDKLVDKADKDAKKDKKKSSEQEPVDVAPTLDEAELTPEQEKKKEEIVKKLKAKSKDFEDKYGDRAKDVMYATATKLAKKTK